MAKQNPHRSPLHPGAPHPARVPDPELTADEEVRWRRWPGLLAMTFGLVGPPLALLFNEETAYALVPWACNRGASWVLHLVPLGYALVIALAGFIAWRDWRETGGGHDDDDATTLHRTRFIALMGLGSAALFGLILLGQWLAIAMIDPCRTP